MIWRGTGYMESREIKTAFRPDYMSFAKGFAGKYLPLERLAGRRLTRKVIACLEHGLVNERLQVMAGDDECARREAEARADMALVAVGLLKIDERGDFNRTGGVLSRVGHWQVEQSRALLHLGVDELCQEVLWRVEALPSALIRNLFNRCLRTTPGEPAVLPLTMGDFWNAGLFSRETVTAARMLECRSRVLDWQAKRNSNDPRVILAYLRALELRLREQPEVIGVCQLLRRVEDAMPFWKEGYQLGEDFFRCDSEVEGGMRTALHVMIQRLYEMQRDPEFPWRRVIEEKALGIVWQYDGQGPAGSKI